MEFSTEEVSGESILLYLLGGPIPTTILIALLNHEAIAKQPPRVSTAPYKDATDPPRIGVR